MRIGGLQKLTLLDFPGHVACTVFLQGCNFRCPFCHNASLVLGTDVISEDEVLRFLKKVQKIVDYLVAQNRENTRYSVPCLSIHESAAFVNRKRHFSGKYSACFSPWEHCYLQEGENKV